MRYWYIDTANQVTMMLIDKGYYDYDFEHKKAVAKQMLYEETVKSETEVRGLLARFGIGQKRSESLDELQEMAMEQLNE